MARTPWLEQEELFVSGQGGYHTYRIPALAVSVQGVVLAFCEGRRNGRGDAGQIELLLRRSADHGRTWSPPQVVAAEPGMTCGNPCPVVDRDHGTIWLPFCKNLADGPEQMIVAGRAPRTVWLTCSRDEGRTWAEPVEITAQVKDPAWTWYATGPGHGIQLCGGRLLIPCDHIVGRDHGPQDPYHSHTVFSDDHGATWRIGGVVPEGTNECAAVETADGAVYLNCRNYRGAKRRAVAWSRDGGESFAAFDWDEELVEPICQASLARLAHPGPHTPGCVLFANPASEAREKMTVRMSHDECRTWSAGRLLYGGPAAYSDLAVLADQTILCLYERGADSPYGMLTLARCNRAWLEAG